MKKFLTLLIFSLFWLQGFGQGVIREYQIRDGDIFARVGDNEIVTGTWTFNAASNL